MKVWLSEEKCMNKWICSDHEVWNLKKFNILFSFHQCKKFWSSHKRVYVWTKLQSTQVFLNLYFLNQFLSSFPLFNYLIVQTWSLSKYRWCRVCYKLRLVTFKIHGSWCIFRKGIKQSQRAPSFLWPGEDTGISHPWI